MRVFVWTIVVISIIECVGRIVWMSNGVYPQRKPLATALDCIAGFAFAAWGLWLLK